MPSAPLVVGCDRTGVARFRDRTPLVEANVARLGGSLALRDLETPLTRRGASRSNRNEEGTGTLRQLGTMPKEVDAQVFADYLLTLGMKVRVDERPDGYSLWIYNEDHLGRAREELSGYLSKPDDPRYKTAVDSAKTIRREERQLDQKFRKNFREAADIWGYPSLRRRPVTTDAGGDLRRLFCAGTVATKSPQAGGCLSILDGGRRLRRQREQQRTERHRAWRSMAAGDADLPAFRHRAHPFQRDGALELWAQ